MNYEFDTLDIDITGSVLTATINNPPINVMTTKLYADLVNFTSQVEQDHEIKVVVFDSADPDFFIAHFDVEALSLIHIRRCRRTYECRSRCSPYH